MKSGNNIFCISIVTCAPVTKEFSPLPDGISSRKNTSRRVCTVVPRDVTIHHQESAKNVFQYVHLILDSRLVQTYGHKEKEKWKKEKIRKINWKTLILKNLFRKASYKKHRFLKTDFERHLTLTLHKNKCDRAHSKERDIVTK